MAGRSSSEIRLSAEFGRRFQILKRLGRGGAGMVFQAQQLDLKRPVAIKLVDPALFADEVAMERFAQEARVTSELRHPNILQIFESGVDEGPDGPVPYIVYELVEGADLTGTVRGAGGRLPVDRTLAVMIEVLRGLAVAHAQEPIILHRDIKPDNILISKDGAVKVADFGIAKRQGEGPRTQTGMVVGTPTYMSPEQAQGLPLTATSDLYSVGIMAYECLVGRPPFVGPSGMEVAVMHVRDPAPPPSRFDAGVPPEMDEILLKVLEKDPLARQADAPALIEAFELARRSYGLWAKRKREGGINRSAPTLARPVGPMKTGPAALVPGGSADTGAMAAGPGGGAGRSAPRAELGMGAPLATRAVELPGPAPAGPAPLPGSPRGAVLGAGALFLLVAGLAIMRGGGGGGDMVPASARFEPLRMRSEVGCLAASLIWESVEPYPSRVFFRREGSSGGFTRAGGSEEATRQHRVELDGLEPGKSYEYELEFPDGSRGLPQTFATRQIQLLEGPTVRVEAGGILKVAWKTSLPVRAAVSVRQRGAGRSGEVKTFEVKGYRDEVSAEEKGVPEQGEYELRILFWTEWWDGQLARNLEDRKGPELVVDGIPVASALLEARARRDRLAACLRELARSTVMPLVDPTPELMRAWLDARTAGDWSCYFQARREFEPELARFFEAGTVELLELKGWYQDVAGFDDWVQSLEFRRIPNPFDPAGLYAPALKPQGTASRHAAGGPFVRAVPLPLEGAGDPAFEAVLRPGAGSLTVKVPEGAAGSFAETELGVKVAGLSAQAILRVDLGDGLQLRYRRPKGAVEDPLWLYHEVPARLLPAAAGELVLELYTAPDTGSGPPVHVEDVVLRGRIRR